jgi:ammonia channel protein AmtB
MILIIPTLQIFAARAVGGFVGNLMTGLFAQASVAGAGGITCDAFEGRR